MESIGQIAFLELDPAQGIRMAWLKYQYNSCIAKLNLIKGQTQEQPSLLDKCAEIYQQIQAQEVELRRKQRLSRRAPASTTDQENP